ncbi:hypothetical protein PFISCL1PPCAC_21241, partial [Pristionchus fissidentatus]
RQLQQSRSCSNCSPEVQQEHPPIRRPLSPVATVCRPRHTLHASELEAVYSPSDTVSNRYHSSDTVSTHFSTPIDHHSNLIGSDERRSRDRIVGGPSAPDLQQLQHMQHAQHQLIDVRARSRSAAVVDRHSAIVRRSPRIQLQEESDDPRRDYSPEAIRGAVLIYDVPFSTTVPQLVAFLSRMGPVAEVTWPVYKRVPYEYYAIAKYEDDEAAWRAVALLTGSRLDGVSVLVRQAKYWYKGDPRCVVVGKRRQEEV